MTESLITYLTQRAEATGFLMPTSVPRALSEIFPRSEAILPSPYRIFFADETLPAVLGYPIYDSAAMHELDGKFERWLDEEVIWNLERDQPKERLNKASVSYFTHLSRLAENSLHSSLLADYHSIFWLAHSIDLSRHFSQLQRRIVAFNQSTPRPQMDAIKYRIYSKWASEALEMMNRIASRSDPVLEGEEERAVKFFQSLRENVLILTEEFIGPDLRELRSFLAAYLLRDFNAFRDSFERIRNTAAELLRQDHVFRSALELMDFDTHQGITIGFLVDQKFQRFLFGHPLMQRATNREERDQFHLVTKRLAEFALLHQLRRGIIWMEKTPWGDYVSVDKRPEVTYSKSTRPIDFGRPGVVDPMVHRFGLMYDISEFSATLGRIARGGQKGEMKSYRQMLLFQKKIDVLSERHRLQFEKFLGDGAFYTTRRALRLIKAAVEIQTVYGEFRRSGFAYDKGLRVAVNYGYYRLLPMKGSPEATERTMEFYGPGVVELSRLTTGKASREIEEIQGFLIGSGYEADQVQKFFAPLARGADVIDRTMHEREFYAYLNASGHLVNEGIVASLGVLQEVSNELAAESVPLYFLNSSWGTYIGFLAALDGVKYIGIRLIGSVALKGLHNIDVGEITPFQEGETTVETADESESLVTLLRQTFHAREDLKKIAIPTNTTEEREVTPELILCTVGDDEEDPIFVLGSWDPLTDVIRRPVQIAHSELARLLGSAQVRTEEAFRERREEIRDLYLSLSKSSELNPLPLDLFRRSETFVGYLLTDPLEKL